MQKEGREERERERELRPKRTFGRGCEMKESRGGGGGFSEETIEKEVSSVEQWW